MLNGLTRAFRKAFWNIISTMQKEIKFLEYQAPHFPS